MCERKSPVHLYHGVSTISYLTMRKFELIKQVHDLQILPKFPNQVGYIA